MPKATRDGDGLFEKKSFPFTPERLDKACRLVRARGGRREWRDESCKQLTVRVGVGGGVYYRFGRDIETKRLKKTRIGDIAGPNRISLETARKKCDALRVDPKATAGLPRRRSASGGPAIAMVWAAYKTAAETGRFSMTTRKTPLRASTLRAYQELYDCKLKPLEEKGINWLAENVKPLFEAIGTRGTAKSKKASPATANKFLQVCRNLFEFAREEGWWNGPNPSIDPRTGRAYAKFSLPKRATRLTSEQTKSLKRAMKAAGPFWDDFFTLSLLTGRRLANVRTLRWGQIDLVQGVITDSGEDMKNGRPQVSPLSETVLTILRRRRADAGPEAEFVFPGRRANQPIKNPDHAWDTIRVAAGLKSVRIHDLRHTAASWATSEGSPQASVGRFLSHASPTSTARYTHADLSDSRGVCEKVEKVYLNAGS